MSEVTPENLKSRVFSRLALAWDWKKKQANDWVARRLVRFDTQDRIRVRWPWPLKKPWQRAKLEVVSWGGGLGDELMCTPVLREIKRLNPAGHLTFHTRYPEIFKGFPFVDKLIPWERKNERNAIYLTYGPVLPPPRPWITMTGECAGVEVEPFELEQRWWEITESAIAMMAPLKKPRIVVQTLTSHWTPNKNWPSEQWRTLIGMLAEHYDLMEVGSGSHFTGEDLHPRFHSQAGKTSLIDFASLIAQADVFVGPDSAGMHVANVCRVPSVIIFGGYTSPGGVPYNRVTPFYTPEPCAPCWLSTGCPYDIRCLRKIEPAQVFEAVKKLVDTP